jgi:hypothetical protein
VRFGFGKALRVAISVLVAVTIFRFGGLIAVGAAFVVTVAAERLHRQYSAR